MLEMNTPACTSQHHTTDALIRRRNAIAAVAIGIFIGYTLLVSLFFNRADNLSWSDKLLPLLGLGCTLISCAVLLGGAWQKVQKKMRKRNERLI